MIISINHNRRELIRPLKTATLMYISNIEMKELLVVYEAARGIKQEGIKHKFSLIQKINKQTIDKNKTEKSVLFMSPYEATQFKNLWAIKSIGELFRFVLHIV